MVTENPFGKSPARGGIQLEPGEHVVRECDTVLSVRPITLWEHLTATITTLFAWPIVYLWAKFISPKISLRVVLTNQRVSFFYEGAPHLVCKPASRSEQHFPLSSVAAVQETYKVRTRCFSSKQTFSTIRIWFRSFPEAFPNDIFPESTFPTSAVRKLTLRDATAKAGTEIRSAKRSSYLVPYLALCCGFIVEFVVVKAVIKAVKLGWKLMDEARSYFVASSDVIEFPWSPSDSAKLSQSNSFVADLCAGVADLHKSVAHQSASQEVSLQSGSTSTVVFSHGNTPAFPRQSFGHGVGEMITGGAVLSPRIAVWQWLLTIVSGGLYYLLYLRNLDRTKVVLITTSHRIITTVVTKDGSPSLSVSENDKNNSFDTRHVFFGGVAQGGYVYTMKSRACDYCTNSRTKLTIATRYGLVTYDDRHVDKKFRLLLEKTFINVIQHSDGKKMFNETEDNQPVKLFGFISRYLRNGELHVASIAGKSRRTCGCLGKLWDCLRSCSCHQTRWGVSVIVTSERIFFIRRSIEEAEHTVETAIAVLPLSKLTYFVHTDVQMFRGCCCFNFRNISGFGSAGLDIKSSVGDIKVPYVHLDTDEKKFHNFISSLRSVSARNSAEALGFLHREQTPDLP